MKNLSRFDRELSKKSLTKVFDWAWENKRNNRLADAYIKASVACSGLNGGKDIVDIILGKRNNNSKRDLKKTMDLHLEIILIRSYSVRYRDGIGRLILEVIKREEKQQLP